MQMKPSDVKLCCLIGQLTTMGVASECIGLSLPTAGDPEVKQEYFIPINEVGNQWFYMFQQAATLKILMHS